MLLVVLMGGIISGCKTIESYIAPTERKVVSNALYSSEYPNGVFNVDESIKYVDMYAGSETFQFSGTPGSTRQWVDNYIFASADEKKMLDRVLVINFWKIATGGYWIPGFNPQESVEVGKYIRDDQRFDTTIYYHSISREAQSSILLEDNSFILPSCMVFKTYQRVYGSTRFPKNKMHITYGEPINCNEAKELLIEQRASAETDVFLKSFNKRADASFVSVSY